MLSDFLLIASIFPQRTFFSVLFLLLINVYVHEDIAQHKLIYEDEEIQTIIIRDLILTQITYISKNNILF